MLLTRLSVGRFNIVIIFRPQPDLPADGLSNIMIPANCADKFKGLEIANNGCTEVHLPANFRQQKNNSWNGRVVYWFSKTGMINWLLHVLTAALEINSSTTCTKGQLIPASDMHLCAAPESLLIKANLFFCHLQSKRPSSCYYDDLYSSTEWHQAAWAQGRTSLP